MCLSERRVYSNKARARARQRRQRGSFSRVVCENPRSLSIVAEDSDLDAFAYDLSEEFEVSVNEPYEIVISTYPAVGTGGVVMGIQPSLALLDRGGNLVSDWSSGRVTVSLLDTDDYPSPVDGVLLRPTTAQTVGRPASDRRERWRILRLVCGSGV